MSQSEPTTDLAPAPAALPEKKKSLLVDLASAAGVEPKLFFDAVKVAAGCKGAQDAHFMVMLMQAQKYDLDPLSSPPMLQLLDVGQGPQVYARVDAYKKFINDAKKDGVVEWTKYEEKWLPDPAVSPEDKPKLIRAGVFTGKLKREPEPVTEIVYFREWAGKGQWVSRGSQMLRHRAGKEWCREHLGYYLADEDDAEKIRDNAPKQVQAEVRDSALSGVRAEPAIPIRTVTRVPVAPPPPDLEEQGNPGPSGDPAASTSREVGASSESPAAPASPAPPEPEAPPFDEAESLRLDAMAAAENAKPKENLFEP